MDIPILYQDKHITILNKPAGMPSVPDRTGDTSVLDCIGSAEAKPIHRLDRPVGGLMAIAHTSAAAAGFGNPPQLKKTYYAVACGRFPKKGALENKLWKDQRKNISYVKENHPKAKNAILHYKTLAVLENSAWGDLSLLEINLVTGRHHQIRVQLAYAHGPLWGDTKYNPQFQRGKYLLGLFACQLSFAHPVTGKKMEFSMPLPKESPFAFFNQTSLE